MSCCWAAVLQYSWPPPTILHEQKATLLGRHAWVWLPIAEKEPSGVKRRCTIGAMPVAEKELPGSRAAAATAARECAEVPERASKGGLEVQRRLVEAATTALPRHVQDREVYMYIWPVNFGPVRGPTFWPDPWHGPVRCLRATGGTARCQTGPWAVASARGTVAARPGGEGGPVAARHYGTISRPPPLPPTPAES